MRRPPAHVARGSVAALGLVLVSLCLFTKLAVEWPWACCLKRFFCLRAVAGPVHEPGQFINLKSVYLFVYTGYKAGSCPTAGSPRHAIVPRQQAAAAHVAPTSPTSHHGVLVYNSNILWSQASLKCLFAGNLVVAARVFTPFCHRLLWEMSVYPDIDFQLVEYRSILVDK